MEKRNRLLILTFNKYPEGDAGAVRQHSFAKLFSAIGFDVTVIGMGEHTAFKEQIYDGIPYLSFRHIGKNYASKVKNILLYKKNLKSYLRKDSADVIMVVDIPFHALLWVKKHAKKNKICLLHDSVEWYSPEQFRLRSFDPSYIMKHLYNTKWIDKSFKVIAISNYLEKHFTSRGLQAVRVPVIFDTEKAAHRKSNAIGKLTVLYAGSPGKKDYLKEVIEGFCLLNEEELNNVKLKIIGADRTQLIKLCGVSKQAINKLGEHLLTLGRLPRDEVLKQLEEADFTVLLRSPEQRYAKAGFPTKVVESLASATPVICNITSDLGDYIKDGENGIIVDGCSAEAFCGAIRKALKLSESEKTQMQKNARKTAENSFDYRKYAQLLSKLIKGV